jgi:hypothetical protein
MEAAMHNEAMSLDACLAAAAHGSAEITARLDQESYIRCGMRRLAATDDYLLRVGR